MPTKLNILAIDTVTEACSVALNLGGVVTREFQVAPNGHSRLVLGMVESLLQQADFDLRQLDALAVDVGPGSFTGARIGIGVAQGLAYGAGLGVIAVGSLAALAEDVFDDIYSDTYSDTSNDTSDDTATVLAAIDARMGQVYYGLYRKHQQSRALIEPALAAPQSLAIGNAKNIIGVGSGWDRYGEVMQRALNGSVTKWLAGRHPDAAAVSRIAAARGLSSALSPLQLTAAYVRDEVAKIAPPPD